MEEERKDRFTFDEEMKIIEPSCKNCKYSINSGVDGCEQDYQTLEIKFGKEKCKEREAK